MRILIINPNSSRSVTKRIDAAAQMFRQHGEQIITICAETAPELIVTPQEAEKAETAVTKAVRSWSNPVDGIILASFGDTGLAAVRAISSVPVVGIAQSAYAMATVLGPRFGIVSFAEAMAGPLRETVEGYGYGENLAVMHMVADAHWQDPGEIQDSLAPQLLALCQRVVRENQADSIVLGGGPLAGLAARLQARVPLPVIDGVNAAVATLRVALMARPCTSLDAFEAALKDNV